MGAVRWRGATHIVGLASLAAALVGCVQAGSADPPARADQEATSTAPPVDVAALPDDRIVLQVTSGGGLTSPVQEAAEVADLTLLGDGRLLVAERWSEHPHDVGPEVRTVVLDPGQLGDLLDEIEASELFTEEERDLGEPFVPDQTTTVAVLDTDGEPRAVAAYALELPVELPDGGGLSRSQLDDREALRALIDQVRALADGGEPWAPDRVRAVAFPPGATEEEPSADPAPWPGPAEALGGGERTTCTLVGGDDAGSLWTAASSRADGWWVAADGTGEPRLVVVAPLVPGDEACPG